MQLRPVVAIGVLVGTLAFGWYFLDRDQSTAMREVDPDAVAAAQGGSTSIGKPPAARPPTSANAVIERAPLPPEGTPLATIHDDLATRARAGDNTAAMRLAFDLRRCKSYDPDTPTLTVEQLKASVSGPGSEENAKHVFELIEAERTFCTGVDPASVDSHGEWILLVAQRGDAEAMGCYVAHPNDFGPKFLSDAWFAWSEHWRDRAPSFAEQAYALGRADMLFMLADAYSGNTHEGEPMSPVAFSALVKPDAVRAAAYAEMASRVGATNPEYANDLRARLDEFGKQRAAALVSRDWPRFARSPQSPKNSVPCLSRLLSHRR